MTCYNCGNTLNDTNTSAEHIINRSIGGHLTSKKLLCKDCNSIFGSGIDVILNKQLGDFGFHLNIKLQSGEHEGHRVLSTISGKKIKVRPGLVPYDTIREVNGNDVLWEYQVDPSEFGRHMEKKKRELEKKGRVEGNEYIVPPTKEKYFIPFEGAASPDDIIIGGLDFHRSIAKMCLNYYLHNDLPVEYCKDVLSFVKGESRAILSSYYYPSNEVIHDLQPGEVSHILHIRGSSEQGVIYAYIELFNMIQVVIPFSFQYLGEDVSYTYSWDLINGVELNKNIKLRLVRHHLEDLPLMNNAMSQKMAPLRDRLFSIIEERAVRDRSEL